MNLNLKAVSVNFGAVVAGAWAMAIFAQTNVVDLYAIIAQVKKTWGDLVVTWTMLLPVLTIGYQAYRTYGMKQVPAPALVVDTGSASKAQTDAEHPPGNVAEVQTVGGTVVGKVVG